MTVGIVVVSHSRALADAAVALAREMAPADLRIEVAAGIDDGTDGGGFGTDATAIAGAVAAADAGDGAVVLMDLGSAVLSAELALDLLDDPDARDRVLLCPAPLVEGLVVAAVTAGSGAGREEVAAEAAAALTAKQEQLGAPAPAVAASVAPGAGEVVDGFTVTLPHGLHARPAAKLAALVRGLPGEVRIRNTTTGSGWAPAASLTRVAALAALQGHRVEVSASGDDARAALDAVLDLAGRAFDEEAPAEAAAAAPLRSAVPRVSRGGAGPEADGRGRARHRPGRPARRPRDRTRRPGPGPRRRGAGDHDGPGRHGARGGPRRGRGVRRAPAAARRPGPARGHP